MLYPWAFTPPAWVGIPLHDNSLDLRYHTVITGGHIRSRHLSDTQSDSLSLGGHHHNLFSDLNSALEAEETGDHEFGAKADSIDSAILHNQTLVVRKKDF